MLRGTMQINTSVGLVAAAFPGAWFAARGGFDRAARLPDGARRGGVDRRRQERRGLSGTCWSRPSRRISRWRYARHEPEDRSSHRSTP